MIPQHGPIELCIFTIEGRKMALPLASVAEIVSDIPVTPVPKSHSSILGLVNLRGKLFLLLNLKSFLFATHSDESHSKQLIFFKGDIGENFGVAVEKVQNILTMTVEEIEKAEQGKELNTSVSIEDCIWGTFSNHGEQIALLEPERILDRLPDRPA